MSNATVPPIPKREIDEEYATSKRTWVLANLIGVGGRPGVIFSQITDILAFVPITLKNQREDDKRTGFERPASFFDHAMLLLSQTWSAALSDVRSLEGMGHGNHYLRTRSALYRLMALCQAQIDQLEGAQPSSESSESDEATATPQSMAEQRAVVLERIESELLAPSRLSKGLSEQAESFGITGRIVEWAESGMLADMLRKMQLRYGASGASEEIGELHKIVRKHIDMQREFDAEAWNEELGDLLFYLVFCARVGGTTLDRVVAGQLQKLERRFGGAWSADKAIAKADKVK